MWHRTLYYTVLSAALVVPFFIQKAHLDATRGGWRPDLANFSSNLLVPSIALLLILLALLPISRKSKLVVSALLLPVFILAFGLFSMVYSCDNYNNSCF